MSTASVQGIFNLLILGFGLTGPYRNDSSKNSIPIEFDAPVIQPPHAAPITSPVTATISTKSEVSFELAPKAVLSVLRGILTVSVAVNTAQVHATMNKIEISQVARLAASFLQRELPSYLAAESDPLWQNPRQDTRATRGFYGLADTLWLSLSGFFEFDPVENSGLMEQLSDHIQNSLVAHPEHAVFLRNTSEDTLSGRAFPDFTKCKDGPLISFLASEVHFSFWREWYQGFLDGKPMDWELQRRVAMIPDEDWEKGPEHIARMIEEIRRDFEDERETTAVSKPDKKPVPAAQAEAMAKKLANNRDAIALTAASVFEQISDFRERVRGNNQLEPEFREKLLDFLDDLSAQLNALLELLPEDRKAPDEAAGEKGVRWLGEFKASFFKEGAIYASPENVAKATIPTGIILGCTGLGTLLGMPLAGAAVGGLITGQIKPGKAAEDLMKPGTPDAD